MKTRGWRVAGMRHAWLLALAAGACGGDSDPTGPGNGSRFDITVRYVGDIPAVQRQIIETAVGRWRSGIWADTFPVRMTAGMACRVWCCWSRSHDSCESSVTCCTMPTSRL